MRTIRRRTPKNPALANASERTRAYLSQKARSPRQPSPKTAAHGGRLPRKETPKGSPGGKSPCAMKPPAHGGRLPERGVAVRHGRVESPSAKKKSIDPYGPDSRNRGCGAVA